MTDRTDAPVPDVSVIIPVYNTGPFLSFCVDSLLRQSLPRERFEAIFVDDGSIDGTEHVLDEIAAEHEHIVVVHQENSGWPGKPRNVGMDTARGRYVFFMDHDDALGDEALERMVAMADADEADILIGKMVGQGRSVPRSLFRENLHSASLATAPLMDSLTPHKLFRSSFVSEHKLRFPEGRRRLEDHVFVVRAYLLARSVSVLADYPCYYHVRREDAGNAAYRSIDVPGYYGNLREVLDIIEELTEPGPFRDRLLRRPLRVEMLRRLQGGELLRRDDADRRALLDEVRRLALERFPDSVAAGLPAMLRVADALVRAGDLEALVDSAEFSRRVHAAAVLTALEWDGDAVVLAFDARLDDEAGPLRFPSADGRILLPVAAGVEGKASTAARDVTGDVEHASVALVLRNRTTQAEYYVPIETSQRVDETAAGDRVVTLEATGAIDPRTASGGRPLDDGRWDLVVRVAMCGWSAETRLGAQRVAGLDEACVALPVGTPPRLVLPYWTEPHGNLTIRVANPTRLLPWKKATLVSAEGRLILDLPLRQALESPPPARLVLRRGRSSAELPLHTDLLDRHHVRWTTPPASVRRFRRQDTAARLVLGAKRSARLEVDLPPQVVDIEQRTGPSATIRRGVRSLRRRLRRARGKR